MELMSVRRRVLMVGKDPNIAYEARNLVFDRTSYVDTGVYLFSAENINRDFELTVNFRYDPNVTARGLDTIVNAMYEVSPWPGFVIRKYNSGSADKVEVAAKNTTKIWDKVDIEGIDVQITRIDGVYKTFAPSLDAAPTVITGSVMHSVHNIPVTLGAGLNSSGNRWREFAGTINHILIKWLS